MNVCAILDLVIKLGEENCGFGPFSQNCHVVCFCQFSPCPEEYTASLFFAFHKVDCVCRKRERERGPPVRSQFLHCIYALVDFSSLERVTKTFHARSPTSAFHTHAQLL